MITGNQFQDFTYSKRSHFEQFSKIGDYITFDIDGCDLLPYQNLFAYKFVIDNLHPGARILQIGEGYLPILEELQQDYECWSIESLEITSQDAQALNNSKGYQVIADKVGNFSDQLPDSYFDCVFSVSVLTKVPEEEKLHDNIYQDINRVLKFGGLSLHLFDILLKKDNVWMNGMLSYILEKNKMLQHSVTPTTQIPADPDLYFMSKAAYEKMWQPTIQQTYEQFGQPVSYNVFWRKVQQRSVASTTEGESSEKLGSKETATAYLRQSYNLQALGKLDEAIAICQKAIKVNPGFSWTYHTLGDLLTEKGVVDDAIASYHSAIKINPNAAWSHYELGKLLEQKEQYEEAIAAYRDSIQCGLEYYGFYEALGKCLMRQGNVDEALSAYQQASQLNPSCEVPEALYNLYTYTTYERTSVDDLEKKEVYRKDNLIYDIGMHIGQDTDFYLKKGFNVVAVDANPLLVQEGKNKFKDYIDSKQLTILNVGIDNKEGSFPFYVNEMLSEWSSFVKEIGARGGKYHEIAVKCTPLEKILSEFGVPYYMKVDIEGHDFKCIQSLQRVKIRPKFVSVENGNGGLLDLLYSLGYDRFKFINQAKVPEIACPNPPLEGNFIDYKFTSGCSGLFGEETSGDWKKYEEVAVEINTYWNNPDRDENIHGWFDLHAKLGN